jgi:hypothetical protein
MDIHLIDETYELFRYFYAVPSAQPVVRRLVQFAECLGQFSHC